MAIRTVLHGGLGNQLFQLLYAELLAKTVGADRVILLTRYLRTYAVGREMELTPLLAMGEATIDVADRLSWIERLRIPKLLCRVTGREVVLRFGGSALVDGYFQAPEAYASYGPARVAEKLDQWKHLLLDQDLIVEPFRQHLTHVRLTDFVAGGRNPALLAAPIVERVPDGGYMITDDEATVGQLIERRPVEGRPILIPSGGMSSWAVLKLMSGFREIDTNGSSLACWAASLTRAKLTSTNPDHVGFAQIGGVASNV